MTDCGVRWFPALRCPRGYRVTWCILLDDETSSSPDEVSECNMWNPLLSTVSHFVFGPTLEDLIQDEDLGKVAMTCHFALDLVQRCMLPDDAAG